VDTHVNISVSQETYTKIKKLSESSAISIGTFVDETFGISHTNQNVYWNCVREWILQFNNSSFRNRYLSLDEDGMICYSDSLVLVGHNLTNIKYNFYYVSGVFNVSHNSLTSFDNFPTVCSRINITNNPNMVLPDYLNDVIMGVDERQHIDNSKHIYHNNIEIVMDYDLFIKTKRQLKLNQFTS
jgi:hypothetical protein